ncbi:MAG: hypothetical protein IH626_05550 [Rhodospirillales bacterium]|nr:hypothetical protein [Rhodospirillales bacterium]
MAKTSEQELGLAVMQVLGSQPNYSANVRDLIKYVPDYITLTEEDHQPSETRPGEEMWEQRVRNLKSHDTSEGNVIREGFVNHVKEGTYQLANDGVLHLKSMGLL